MNGTPIELIVAAFAFMVVLLGFSVAIGRARRRRLEAIAMEPGAALAPVAAEPSAQEEGRSLADWFMRGLSRSREALARTLGKTAAADPELIGLEEALISADVGVTAAGDIVGALKELRRTQAGLPLRDALRTELLRWIGPLTPLVNRQEAVGGPLVILVVGVNGSGKTTTIGKLAARHARRGHKVMLAAGDTFRAGAIEQLKIWGERAGVPVVAHQEGADPAAVIFDAVEAAKARGIDVLICDTAGRLQAQKGLMDELGKVVRVMRKALPAAPHEVLLVLDGTIGQNAISQAEIFKAVVGVTGVALTKLDGTARGGVVVAVRERTGIPVKLIGLGEGIDDLRDFDPELFVDALIGSDTGPPPRPG